MASTGTAIELHGVTETFGKLTAVNRLDLTIPRGALYGFIGPNGKTTAIRMIMPILSIGVAGAFGALWVAAKVFRVGILMFGKAPDFKTLVAWVRAA